MDVSETINKWAIHCGEEIKKNIKKKEFSLNVGVVDIVLSVMKFRYDKTFQMQLTVYNSDFNSLVFGDVGSVKIGGGIFDLTVGTLGKSGVQAVLDKSDPVLTDHSLEKMVAEVGEISKFCGSLPDLYEFLTECPLGNYVVPAPSYKRELYLGALGYLSELPWHHHMEAASKGKVSGFGEWVSEVRARIEAKAEVLG